MTGKASERPAGKPVRLRPRRPCPICKRPSVQEYHPFCSQRCADVDLERWLGGHYAIPAAEEAGEAEEVNPPDRGRQGPPRREPEER
jgi:hypothetical protein